MEPKRPNRGWLEIDGSALRHNAAEMRRAIGPSVRLMAVVKANAYGHGLTQVVRAFGRNYCDWYGVDALSEALAVRSAGGRQPVLIMGYVPLAQIAAAVRQDMSFVVYDPESLRQASRTASAKHPAKVHLKIETGTSRQGISLKDLPVFCGLVRRLPKVVVEGVSTHYANIEDTIDPSYARSQMARYHRALKILRQRGIGPVIRHTAASSAAILFAETHFDLVRAGIALYGLWPSRETRIAAERQGRGLDLRPALTWKTVVAQVKSVPKGTPVSYGLTERVNRPSRIAVVPAGYWDGYDRGLSSVGHVLIRGQRAKVLGRICMNMCVVDVTDIPGVRLEDEVVLLGAQGREAVTADEIAAKLGTINYEVVARINPELPRRLIL